MKRSREEYMDSYFTETDKQHIDGIFYQTMVDEAMRLRTSHSRKERTEIRSFLLKAYQTITESNMETGGRE